MINSRLCEGVERAVEAISVQSCGVSELGSHLAKSFGSDESLWIDKTRLSIAVSFSVVIRQHEGGVYPIDKYTVGLVDAYGIAGHSRLGGQRL